LLDPFYAVHGKQLERMRLTNVQPALFNQAVQLVERVGGEQAAIELRYLDLIRYSDSVSQWVQLLSKRSCDGGAGRPPPETCVRVKSLKAQRE
jgi:hypothetical protein